MSHSASRPEPDSAPAPRRGGRALLVVGLVLVVAGVGVLGYVGWQMFGTNVVSNHRATELREKTQKAWQKGEAGPARSLVRIPRFGKDYEEPIVRGFSDSALARGVGWYPQGADAGQVGNYVLAAHRVTHGEPFAKFPELRKGDRVVIETRDATYTYRLRNAGQSITVDFTTAWPLWPVPDPDAKGRRPTKHVITLLTCSELFHTDNRNVVIGDLVDTERKGTVHEGTGA